MCREGRRWAFERIRALECSPLYNNDIIIIMAWSMINVHVVDCDMQICVVIRMCVYKVKAHLQPAGPFNNRAM